MKRCIDAERTSNDVKRQFTADQNEKAELADTCMRSMMMSGDSLKSAIASGAIRDCPISAEDVDKALQIKGVDTIRLTSSHRSKAAHADKCADGSVDRTRKFSRTKDGKPPTPSILHVDGMEIAGQNVVCTMTEPTKIVRTLRLAQLTGIEMAKSLAQIIDYETSKGFPAEAVQCDKGSNLNSVIVKETLKKLEVGFDPVPTNKHNGAAEGLLRPLREEVMTTLRKMAIRWKYNPAGFMAEWRIDAVWRHAWFQDVHGGRQRLGRSSPVRLPTGPERNRDGTWNASYDEGPHIQDEET